MSNDYFRFRRFTVRQGRCAMKVGTDGTLLGAWANGGGRILDIGTGTGLVALMMAQRFPASEVTAIDIDGEACLQAEENVAASPFSGRVKVLNTPLQEYRPAELFDSVVCNPPFFNDSLKCPDSQRTVARHTSTLSYRDLFTGAMRLLTADGLLTAVIPFDCTSGFEAEAIIAGFHIRRLLAVKTTPRKQPRRYLYEFGKNPLENGVQQGEMVIGSPQYDELTADFYLEK